MCKILKPVYWCSPFCKYKSHFCLVVFGAMRYCIFTGDVGVRLCCCSVGVGVLSNDLVR